MWTKISRENCRQICGKFKASVWSTGTGPKKIVSRILYCVALVTQQSFYSSYLTLHSHTITFNFSRVCLLVKMASKTLTRSIGNLSFVFTFTDWLERGGNIPTDDASDSADSTSTVRKDSSQKPRGQKKEKWLSFTLGLAFYIRFRFVVK